MTLVQWLDRRLYPGFERNWDDRLFRERLLGSITAESVVLDLGAGAGIVAAMDFRGHARRICGIDPDPRVVENPYLDEGRVGVGEAIPYPDATFDLVFADNVLEHLERPDLVFREVARVLKLGGRFLAKTPNTWHYMPLVARLTPRAFHQWVNRWRGRVEADIFPTRYRANTPEALGRLARDAGLRLGRCELIEGRPEYLRMTAPTYLLGCAYERLVNGVSGLAPLRILLVAEFVKPAPGVAIPSLEATTSNSAHVWRGACNPRGQAPLPWGARGWGDGRCPAVGYPSGLALAFGAADPGAAA